MGQGESLATTLDPLVERQSPCRTTSDREPRQEHPRSRQGDLEHSTKKTERDLLVAATGLPPTTAPTHLHPQEKRCDPFPLNWPKKPGDEERHLSEKDADN